MERLKLGKVEIALAIGGIFWVQLLSQSVTFTSAQSYAGNIAGNETQEEEAEENLSLNTINALQGVIMMCHMLAGRFSKEVFRGCTGISGVIATPLSLKIGGFGLAMVSIAASVVSYAAAYWAQSFWLFIILFGAIPGEFFPFPAQSITLLSQDSPKASPICFPSVAQVAYSRLKKPIS